MRLRFLGTSAAMPSADRGHVGFVLWADRPLLVECGPTIPWQLQRLGIDHRSIGEIFISHIHGDHSLGLPMLLTLGELDGRDWPVRVHCPASAVERLRQIGSACYPSQELLMRDKVIWNGLSEQQPCEFDLGGGVQLRTAPGIHGVPAVAYRFDFEGRSLVYSGDTAPAPGVLELARSVDLLLHEATWSESIDGMTSVDHTSARQAGRLASEAGARRLGLVHLNKRYLNREAELLAEAAETFGGEILLPSDGDELTL